MKDLFEDSTFNRLMPDDYAHSKWMRINKLVRHPKYFHKYICVCDIKQSSLGNCFLISPLHAIILYYQNNAPDKIGILLRQINPKQVLWGPDYDGSITIKLFNGFALQDVKVDDFVPTCERLNPKTNEIEYAPLFAYNNHKEYWPTMIEKAIMKVLNLSYQMLDQGGIPESVFRLLLPPAEETFRSVYLIPKDKQLANEFLGEIYKNKDTLTILAHLDSDSKEKILPNGIVTRHAMTACTMNNISPQTLLIVNPWLKVELKQELQYHGADYIPQVTCAQCSKVDKKNDGMWLMRRSDVVNHYNYIYTYATNVNKIATNDKRSANGLVVLKTPQQLNEISIFIYVPNNPKNKKCISNNTNNIYITLGNGGSIRLYPSINLLCLLKFSSPSAGIGDIAFLASDNNLDFVCGYI